MNIRIVFDIEKNNYVKEKIYMLDLKKLVPTEEIIQWRRHFHQNPELSFKEFETAKYIIKQLESFGNLEISQPTETSVIAVLKGSKTGNTGKTVALRADIDALPIQEEANLDFASQNDGVMHACGHDAHTAILLGAAKMLVEMKDSLNGTVKFIFQHAEELLPGGARELVEKNVMDGVDAVFALHVDSMIPVGVVGTVEGVATAAVDTVEVIIKGRGAHASTPEKSIDPITIGSEIVNSINSVISRNIASGERSVISFGRFIAGDMSNIIPDTAKLSISVRTLSEEVRAQIKERITKIINSICEMHGATAEIDYQHGYSSVINDKNLVEMFNESCEKLEIKTIPDGSPMMGSEDFSAYGEKAPGIFYLLGSRCESGEVYSLHNPKVVISEKSFSLGALLHVQMVLDYLG